VQRDAALLAGREQTGTVGGLDARGVKEECGGDDVLATGQDLADVVEMCGARRVQHAVCVERQDLLHVGRRRHADRLTPDQGADVHAVLGVRVDKSPNDLEVVAAVDDGGEYLRADRAGAPLNNAIHARTVTSRPGRVGAKRVRRLRSTSSPSCWFRCHN
jgi:hypothetical protein